MIEIWKDIQGFEGAYQVSNLGRLKSFRVNPLGAIRSNVNSKGDYLTVVLHGKDGVNKHTRMHVLVAEAFLPLKSCSTMQVHHKDENKQNNRIDNLEWVTPRNHRRKTLKTHPQILTGMVNYNKFERPTAMCQYTLEEEYLAEYRSATIASEITGICQRNILQVANKEEYKPGMIRKQAGGYIWRLKGGDV